MNTVKRAIFLSNIESQFFKKKHPDNFKNIGVETSMISRLKLDVSNWWESNLNTYQKEA